MLHLHTAAPDMYIRDERKLLCHSPTPNISTINLSACKRSRIPPFSTALNRWIELLSKLVKTGCDEAALLASLEPSQLVDIPAIYIIHIQSCQESVPVAGVVRHNVPARGNQSGWTRSGYLEGYVPVYCCSCNQIVSAYWTIHTTTVPELRSILNILVSTTSPFSFFSTVSN